MTKEQKLQGKEIRLAKILNKGKWTKSGGAVKKLEREIHNLKEEVNNG